MINRFWDKRTLQITWILFFSDIRIVEQKTAPRTLEVRGADHLLRKCRFTGDQMTLDTQYTEATIKQLLME